MGAIALEQSEYVDPADEVFMAAVQAADMLNRRRHKFDTIVELVENPLKHGWRGWLLRERTEGRRYSNVWGLGGYGSVELMLASDGTMYFGDISKKNEGGGDQLPVYLDAAVLEHCHLYGFVDAAVLFRMIEHVVAVH